MREIENLRPIDSCITQRKAQGPFRTCNESKEEEEENARVHAPGPRGRGVRGTGVPRA